MTYDLYVDIVGSLCVFFIIGIWIWSYFKPVSSLLKLVDSSVTLLMFICVIYNEEEKWMCVLWSVLFCYLILFHFFPRLSIYLSEQ